MAELSILIEESVPKRAPSLAEQAYEAMKGWIVNGELEAGTTLSENDLSRRFAISRSPLREAIRQLQDEGLLAASSARGFSVPPLTVDMVKNVYGVRLALETAAAAGARDIPPAELDAMASRLDAIAHAMSLGDLQPFNDSDFAFHDLFITHCGNPLLIKYIHRLRGNIQRIINYAGRFAGHTQASFEEHLAIFEALKSGDQAAQERAVSDHILGVTTRLITQLER